MANRVRGEATANVDGKQYTLLIDMNSIAGWEDATNMSHIVLLGRMNAGSWRISDTRHLLHQSLLRHHPEVTLNEAGDLIPDLQDALFEAMSRAFPDDEKEDASGEPGNGDPAT